MAHVFGDNEKESDYGYVYKVSGPRTYCSSLILSLSTYRLHCVTGVEAAR